MEHTRGNSASYLVNLPNMLVLLRFVAGPLLLLAANRFGIGTVFLVIFSIAALSDFLDGFVARLLHQESEFGAVLDSIADLFLYAFVTFSFLIAEPLAFDCCRLPVLIFTAIQVASCAISYLKFNRYPSYHSQFNKAVGYGLAFTVMYAVVTHHCDPLSCMIFIAAAASMESIAISLRVKKWSTSISSVLSAPPEDV